MTNYEWLKDRIEDKELFAHELCILVDAWEHCEASKYCRPGHIGFMDWLDEKCQITSRAEWEAEHEKT